MNVIMSKFKFNLFILLLLYSLAKGESNNEAGTQETGFFKDDIIRLDIFIAPTPITLTYDKRIFQYKSPLYISGIISGNLNYRIPNAFGIGTKKYFSLFDNIDGFFGIGVLSIIEYIPYPTDPAEISKYKKGKVPDYYDPAFYMFSFYDLGIEYSMTKSWLLQIYYKGLVGYGYHDFIGKRSVETFYLHNTLGIGIGYKI